MVMEGYIFDEDEDEEPEQNQKFHIRKPVKPYICSTPGDFSEERDFLLENVFPKLREICKLRGGYFSPVDIRWENDDEQVVNGHLLKLLLDYICNCCPYFICLLGETYGPYRSLDAPKLPKRFKINEDADWLDKNYLIAASAGYDWVLQEGHQNTSLTELEIIQAAFLNNTKHCHFYYRQPEHLNHKYGHLPSEEKEKLSQIHLPDSEYADLNIRDLKQRIVNKGIPVRFFKTLEELGNYVMKDWSGIIENVFPFLEYPIEILDQEEYRDWAANETFAEVRRQVFITSPATKTAMEKMTEFALTALDEPSFEPEAELSKLRTHTLTKMLKKKKSVEIKYKSILSVYGDRGCGKSTLIANWIKKFKSENPEIKVIHQYTGSCSKNTDIAYFLRQCIQELRYEFLRQDRESTVVTDNGGPWTFQEVCEAFNAVASLGPSVIVIDGLDEIGATLGKTIRQVKELQWLPFPFPPQCKIICTMSRSDLVYHGLSRRQDCTLLSMPVFNTIQLQMQFLEEHMQQHFHLLNKNHYQQINDVKLTKNPLFLNILGNEIESYSVHSNLAEYLDETYDKISSLRDLCVRCFQRWTKEYSWNKESLYGDAEDEAELELEGWIPDTLRLFAVCRGGLTVEEVLTILQTLGYCNTREVKSYDWLQFRNCIGNFLLEKANGLLDFSHQHLKEIVEYVLLHSLKAGGGSAATSNEPENEWKEQKKKFHSHVAKFFLKQPFCQRTIEELPWQLLSAGDIKTLVKVLTDPVILEGFLDETKKNPSNRQDLAFYWNILKDEGISVTTTYQQMLMKIGILDPVVYDSEDFDREEMSTSMSTEEKSDTPTIPIIITTPAPEGELSIIEETGSIPDTELQKLEESTKKESVAKDDGIDTIFLTESKHKLVEIQTKDDKKGPAFPPFATKLSWLVAMFMKDMGHSGATEDILTSLNNKLQTNYPLTRDDLFLQAKTQEMLGRFCQDRGDKQEAEKWFVKSLRIVMDASDEEEETELDLDLLNLKGCLLSHLGFLRMKEGLYDSAEDLLKEGLEYVRECGNMTARADIQYNLGLLRTQQSDFILAESDLRQSLSTREQWFGNAHPLVADTLFALADLMVKKDSSKGYDKIRAETLYRKTVKIREDCLGSTHLAVADTLLALGKVLMEEISYGAKTEAVGLLRRALDIKTTNLGGDHIDTVSVRNYLKTLEVTLKMGKYEFGPAKETDIRTVERPFSNMSWRDNDLKNLDKRSKLRSSAKSRGSSRPTSRDERSLHSMSRLSNASHITASERLMIETERPARLLNRESVERRLKIGKQMVNGFSGMPDYGRSVITEDKENEEEQERRQSPEQQQSQVQDNIIDSFGVDIARSEESPAQKRTQFMPQTQESGPVKLFKRFGSAESSRSSKHNVRPPRESSARSASSYGTSYRTGSSLKSYSSKKDTNPHSINLGNTSTVTSGPNCSLSSLLGNSKTPRDISRKVHHKSAWYHVPGRYFTDEDKLPPKRSQKTQDVKAMMRRLNMNTPPKIFAPRNGTTPTKFKKHKYFNESHMNNDNFGPTVKGIGPVASEAYSSEYIDDVYENPGSTVTFRGAYYME
ncbi:Hypothetical predicted protein [Mytilus galloprovincialis]|uniref:Nephrocystin 3-like N-terminal domain-containing protein n=1 Tax=Mytilus galloprovincialis TaxID=29158 RepID=A0A8B6H1V9_MYTGA|nr:Hypothetical predicted protein [Mytilus galloprovincialis]